MMNFLTDVPDRPPSSPSVFPFVRIPLGGSTRNASILCNRLQFGFQVVSKMALLFSLDVFPSYEVMFFWVLGEAQFLSGNRMLLRLQN